MSVVFIHGNGGCTSEMHWYPSVARTLTSKGIETVLKTLPDNNVAHRDVWIPYLHDTLNVDDNSILIGHSSGAIAALRYSEEYPVLGTILVSAYHTDLGMENERKGGWFDNPWDWEKITRNQKWIIQFSSLDDPWIPIEEARYIHEKLGSDYYEFKDKGHFTQDEGQNDFPELSEALLQQLGV